MSIATKMVAAMAAIDAVEKKGRNQSQGYNYVRATDVANEVRSVLKDNGIAFAYQITDVQHWEKLKTDDKGNVSVGMFMCEVRVSGIFTDSETGEQMQCDSVGWGADPLDKAAFKAMTGALKYLLRMAFLIPDELDPENDVHAEVERQKAAPSATPPELDWKEPDKSGVMMCRILDAKKTKKKNGDGEVVTLKMNGSIEGNNLAYYFHVTHSQELIDAVGKVVKLVVKKSGKFFNVSEVLEIDGKHVAGPTPADGNLETQARLIASTLGFEEEELQQLLTRYCAGSWSVAIEKMQEEKVRRENAEL